MAELVRKDRLVTSALPPRPTWLEIDLAAIRGNVRLLRQQIGPDRQLFAVVKANAYGHGATLVAPAALDTGADRLAVATVGEALDLRTAGITAPILVLGYTPPWLAETALHHDLALTLYDAELAAAFADVARGQGKGLAVHIKVDTGMHRFGIYPPDLPALLTHLRGVDGLTVEGIYTHFSSADEADKTFSRVQLRQFENALAAVDAVGLRPPLIHAANSAATLSLASAYFNAVRAGIALYGLHPSAETPLPDWLSACPALGGAHRPGENSASG